MFRKIVALSIALFSLGAVAATAQSQAGGSTVKAKHGAWEIRCGVENPDTCLMAQTGNNDEGEPVLQALLRKTPNLKGPNGEAIAAVMEIVAPIGVLLPAGVAVTIDGKEIGRGGFRYCQPQACVVQEPIQDEFVNQLKRGAGAVMTLVGLNGTSLDVKISLSGFTKAYNSL